MSALDEPLKKANEALGKKITSSLLSNGYRTAVYAHDAHDAIRLALGLIPDNCSVGIPGTVTVRELGLPERLIEKKCRVYHHWDPSLTTAEARAARLAEENSADWFVTSSNAVTLDGKMVNIDGTGNRIACMSWGTGRILFIIGLNKVARDLDGAIARARNSATPANSLRTGLDTPCSKTGYCVDCNSPDRACRVISIIERVPFGREAHVILVGEKLGY
ncbi:MAG: lactate utilization protein [Synergistaceae bacterium]|nr:lactate utilization protein [Synergistaceae bacterium]